MTTPIVSQNILNTEKTDYEKTPLFLGGPRGVFDSINENYPRIFELYKRLKNQDWDELEFDPSSCLNEFKSVPTQVKDAMIKTLAFQWETDTVISSQLVPIMSGFVSSSTLWQAYCRIGDNEALHSHSYSEIVRLSFDKPEEVMKEILAISETLKRLSLFAEIADKAFVASHKLALGLLDKDDPEVYDVLFMFVVGVFILERVQFVSSFGVTFGIANANMFIPIGKTVQKICQDEFEIHAEVGREVLRIEMATPRGISAYRRLRSKINQLVKEIIASEEAFINYVTEGKDILPGVNKYTLMGNVLWCINDVVNTLHLDPPISNMPKVNPAGYMKDWIRNDFQGSIQEEKEGNYLLGGFVKDLDEANFDSFDL